MSDDKKVQEAVEAPAPTEAQEQNSLDLTVSDLQGIKAIIDVASQRGAFKPNEMMSVGQVYTKLEAFLNAVAAQQQAGQEPAKGE
jgi:hypothetical protein